jgi:hypothetical protein
LFEVDFAVLATASGQPHRSEPSRGVTTGGQPQEVKIFFVGNPSAWSFILEHDDGAWVDWDRVDDDGYLINADGKWIDDEGNLSSEGFLAIEHDEGQLRYILESLEIGAYEEDVHHFVDQDGETMYFRALEIALFEVPNSNIKPWDREEDEEP